MESLARPRTNDPQAINGAIIRTATDIVSLLIRDEKRGTTTHEASETTQCSHLSREFSAQNKSRDYCTANQCILAHPKGVVFYPRDTLEDWRHVIISQIVSRDHCSGARPIPRDRLGPGVTALRHARGHPCRNSLHILRPILFSHLVTFCFFRVINKMTLRHDRCFPFIRPYWGPPAAVASDLPT